MAYLNILLLNLYEMDLRSTDKLSQHASNDNDIQLDEVFQLIS